MTDPVTSPALRFGMLQLVRKSLGRKLLLAVGLPSLLFALGVVLWLKFEAQRLAPGAGGDAWWLGMVALLLVAGVMGSAHLLAVRVLVEQPLQRLAAAMRRCQEGDFLHRMPVDGQDELAELARCYNTTLAAVTDLHVRRLEDAHSMEAMQRELRLQAEIEAQHRLVAETNARLERRLSELTLLSDLTRTLSSTLELDQLLAFVTELVGRNLGYDAFELLLAAEGTGELVVKSTFGVEGRSIGRVAAPEEPAARAARERRLLYVRAEGSTLAVPMLHRGECMGVLCLFRAEVEAFGEDEMRLLQSVASQAALAIANARLHQKTVRLSLTDPLTGVHNRRSLFQRLEMELDRAERYGQPVAVAMIDVDHFKHFNDNLGHLAGDAVLRRVGAVLGDAVRKVDTVGRYGGEEFALVLPQTDRASALQAAEKLRRLVESTPFEHAAAQPGGKVTVSVGVAAYPDDARDLATLVDCADAALYAAKKAGRNAALPYEEGMRERPGRLRDVRVTAQVDS